MQTFQEYYFFSYFAFLSHSLFFLLLFFPLYLLSSSLYPFLSLLFVLFSQSFSVHHNIKIVHFCNKNFLKIAKKQKYYTFIGKQKKS